MNKDDLIRELNELAAEWRATPSNSNSHQDAIDYNRIKQSLSELGVKAYIKASDKNSVDYQVYFA